MQLEQLRETSATELRAATAEHRMEAAAAESHWRANAAEAIEQVRAAAEGELALWRERCIAAVAGHWPADSELATVETSTTGGLLDSSLGHERPRFLSDETANGQLRRETDHRHSRKVNRGRKPHASHSAPEAPSYRRLSRAFRSPSSSPDAKKSSGEHGSAIGSDGRVGCPHCGRRFDPDVAER
eukprot:SAG31_NODE_864_length_11392_cov_21.929868_6_plen_185_part_00